jgi:hypothetical protein
LLYGIRIPISDYETELAAPGALLGAPFSQFLLGPIGGWPASTDMSYTEVQDSDIETLLVSGSLDGSTPLRYARDELLPHLSNGHHVVVQGQSHTESFWYSQPEARVRLLNTFFDSGRVDDSLFESQAVVFGVGSTWGGLATALLTAAASVAAVVAVLVAVVIRRFSNRSTHLLTPVRGANRMKTRNLLLPVLLLAIPTAPSAESVPLFAQAEPVA